MIQDPNIHYLDNAATTMVAPEVADVIDKAMREHWANPSSLYAPGARSEEALNAARAAVAMGYDVTVVDPRADGTLSIDEMLEHVDKNTILVACMMVNNEIGTRNDVERLAAEVKRRNSRTIVHVDAVQAWMRVPLKLANIDTLSVSGHKIHAPKGIGALYLSDRVVQAFQPP